MYSRRIKCTARPNESRSANSHVCLSAQQIPSHLSRVAQCRDSVFTNLERLLSPTSAVQQVACGGPETANCGLPGLAKSNVPKAIAKWANAKLANRVNQSLSNSIGRPGVLPCNNETINNSQRVPVVNFLIQPAHRNELIFD